MSSHRAVHSVPQWKTLSTITRMIRALCPHVHDTRHHKSVFDCNAVVVWTSVTSRRVAGCGFYGIIAVVTTSASSCGTSSACPTFTSLHTNQSACCSASSQHECVLVSCGVRGMGIVLISVRGVRDERVQSMCGMSRGVSGVSLSRERTHITVSPRINNLSKKTRKKAYI